MSIFGSFKPEHRSALTLESQKEFWAETVGIMLFQVSVMLPLVVCSFLIGSFGEAFSLSVFGLGNTCVNLAFNGLLIGVSENLGVHASKLFAQRKYHAVNNLLGKTITVLVALVVLALFVFSNSGAILLFCGFERSVAEATHRFLLASRWYVGFMAFNSAAVSLLISQKINRPLLAVNAATIVAMSVSGRLLVVDWDMREMGVPYARLIQEALGSLCYAYLLVFRAERETFTNFHLRWIVHDYWSYLRELLATVSNFYSEFLCFEVNIYFVGLLHNLTEMAVWITLCNSVGTIFYISVALANSVRTLVGHMVGQGRVELARARSVHYFVYIYMFLAPFTAAVLVFKYQIGWLFTGSPFLAEKMASVYVLNALNFYPTLTLYCLNTIMRVLDYHDLLFRINTVYNVLMTVVFSYVFCFLFDLKAQGINLGFTMAKSLTVAYAFYMLYWRLEWKAEVDIIARQTEVIEAEEQSFVRG